MPWPADGASLTALTDEIDLPFRDYSFDRVLLVHAPECAERVRPMTREIWRMISGGGRLRVDARPGARPSGRSGDAR